MPYRVVIWVQRAHERDRGSERTGRKWTTETRFNADGQPAPLGDYQLGTLPSFLPSFAYGTRLVTLINSAIANSKFIVREENIVIERRFRVRKS